jgi:hypothetical protein
MSLPFDRIGLKKRIAEVAALLRVLVAMSDHDLPPRDSANLIRLLDQVVESMGARADPIKFKDALGRKFRFPYSLCKSWKVH